MTDVRRRCAERVADDVTCGRQFRPPIGSPAESRCPAHRVAAVPAAPVQGEIVAAVRAELERCRATGSLAGALALRLAVTLDDPSLAASSVGALTAQLARVMAPLQAAAPREPDKLDALQARLAAKLGAVS